MMTNVHMLFRYWRGRTDHARVPELMNLMRKQALLAYKLPDAQPAIMRNHKNLDIERYSSVLKPD